MKDLRMLVTLLKRKVYHTKGMIPTYTHGLTNRIELRHAHNANTRLPSGEGHLPWSSGRP